MHYKATRLYEKVIVNAIDPEDFLAFFDRISIIILNLLRLTKYLRN